jgi:8-oxo-dGTP pyrophosphatase MutT (NUDIX family)
VRPHASTARYDAGVPRLDSIRARLRAHRPTLAEPPAPNGFEASVALVLHEPPGAGAELLFIERAVRAEDPWSGHMAFPGGRRQSSDADLSCTACRETLEEVGFEPKELLGQLDDFSGSRGPAVPSLRVSAFVYEAAERPIVIPSPEVQSAVWVPLAWILQAESVAEHVARRSEREERFPAFRYERYLVWGLTYRILRGFVSVIGHELPSGR